MTFDGLLARYPGIPKSRMGIPENWRECPIWQRMSAGLTGLGTLARAVVTLPAE